MAERTPSSRCSERDRRRVQTGVTESSMARCSARRRTHSAGSGGPASRRSGNRERVLGNHCVDPAPAALRRLTENSAAGVLERGDPPPGGRLTAL